MVHLRSENVPNDATSFCAIFCRFLLFMQFWETMIETANSSMQKEDIFKEQHHNSSFKIWWFQLFAVSLRHTNRKKDYGKQGIQKAAYRHTIFLYHQRGRVSLC